MVLAICFLLSVLWLPVNLFYWLSEDSGLHGLAALLNTFTVFLCFHLNDNKGSEQ